MSFEVLDKVCKPVSALTFAALLGNAICKAFGLSPFSTVAWVEQVLLPILGAASVGYMTNWLAITMLFRPYEPKKWLFLWPQGLLPRNRAEIARKVGEECANGILAPAKIAEYIKTSFLRELSGGNTVRRVREKIQHALTERASRIPFGGNVIVEIGMNLLANEEGIRQLLGSCVDAVSIDGVVGKLNVGQRIEDGINNLSIPEFHAMVNRLAAKHLCAIQVLGFVLGGMIGLLLCA